MEKRKELRDDISIILHRAKDEHLGHVENKVKWTCYDSDKYEKRIITNEVNNTGLEIGSRMATNEGDTGQGSTDSSRARSFLK